MVFHRHLVADAVRRAPGVVFLPGRTGDHLRVQHAADQLPAKAFVPAAAVKALVRAILLLAVRFHEADPNASLRLPLLQRTGQGLTPVVAPQVSRSPVQSDCRLQRPDPLRGPESRAGNEIEAVMAALLDSWIIVRSFIVLPAVVTSTARSRHQTSLSLPT